MVLIKSVVGKGSFSVLFRGVWDRKQREPKNFVTPSQYLAPPSGGCTILQGGANQ